MISICLLNFLLLINQWYLLYLNLCYEIYFEFKEGLFISNLKETHFLKLEIQILLQRRIITGLGLIKHLRDPLEFPNSKV